MRIKIDVDGVLRDMLSVMIDIYNKKYQDNLTVEDIKDYNLFTSFPKLALDNINPYHYFFDKLEEETVLHSQAFNNVVSSINLLKKANHTIIIVTDQPLSKSKIDTIKWLDNWAIPYDEIHFTSDKWAINGDILIDDNPKFLNDNREKSIKFCIDMPYNKNVIESIICNDFNDAVQMILKL